MAIQPLKLEFVTREYYVGDIIPVDLSGIHLSDASRIVVRVWVRTSPDEDEVGVPEPNVPIAKGAWEKYNPVGADPTPIVFIPYHEGYYQATLRATTMVDDRPVAVNFRTPIVRVLA